jgi:hypothetical protein
MKDFDPQKLSFSTLESMAIHQEMVIRALHEMTTCGHPAIKEANIVLSFLNMLSKHKKKDSTKALTT